MYVLKLPCPIQKKNGNKDAQPSQNGVGQYLYRIAGIKVSLSVKPWSRHWME